MELLRGRLLVATPALLDPNFSRAVLLLLEHGTEGAFGVVLNRPTDAEVGEALPGWAEVAADPAVVFAGGPVGPDRAIGLGRAYPSGPGDGWAPLFDRLGSVDLGAEPESIPDLDTVRVFVGYAGWGAGQLEGEIAEGSWFVVDARVDLDVFSPDPDALWRAVLARQRGRLAWFAHCPADLSSN